MAERYGIHVKNVQSFLGVAAFLAVFLYLLHLFIPIEILPYIYSFLTFLLLLCGLVLINPVNKIVVISLLVLGSLVFFRYEVDMQTIWLSFGENLNLLALFLLIPLYGTLMSEAGYLQALKTAIARRELTKKARPYRLGYILTASMGSLLNLGSMPLVHRISEESFSKYEEKRFGMTLLRGFGFCMLWSPYFVNVGLVLVLYDLSWQEIGIYSLFLAFVYTIVTAMFFPFLSFKDDRDHTLIQNETRIDRETRRLLWAFAAYVIILLFSSFYLDSVLEINMLTVVSILALILPLAWSVAAKVTKEFLRAGAGHIKGSFVKLHNELTIFITAGFIGVALSETEIGEVLSEALLYMSQGIVPVFSFLLVGTAILLAFIGIHPVIIVIGLGSSLSPESFGVEASYMGLLMLAAWTLSTQLSPFSGSVLLASHLMKTSPLEIVKKNVVFILVIMFLFTFLLWGIHGIQNL